MKKSYGKCVGSLFTITMSLSSIGRINERGIAMITVFSEEYKEKIIEVLKAQRDLALEKWHGQYIQIHIFPDDSVFVLDEKNSIIPPQDTAPIEGPENTYPQAVWLNSNPQQCAWINGKRI